MKLYEIRFNSEYGEKVVCNIKTSFDLGSRRRGKTWKFSLNNVRRNRRPVSISREDLILQVEASDRWKIATVADEAPTKDDEMSFDAKEREREKKRKRNRTTRRSVPSLK